MPCTSARSRSPIDRSHAPQAVEHLVVEHDDRSVAGAPKVELHHVRAERDRHRERRQRVLPLAHRLAPVGDCRHTHEAMLRRRGSALGYTTGPPRVLDAVEEGVSENEGDGALRDARHDERHADAPRGGHTAGNQRAEGGRSPDEAAPGATHSAHQIVGGQALAKGHGHHGSCADGQPHDGEGGPGQHPALSQCHHEIADARGDGSGDERSCRAEAPRDAIGEETAEEGARGPRRQEETVGALGDAPFRCRGRTRTPLSIPWSPARDATRNSSARATAGRRTRAGRLPAWRATKQGHLAQARVPWDGSR